MLITLLIDNISGGRSIILSVAMAVMTVIMMLLKELMTVIIMIKYDCGGDGGSDMVVVFVVGGQDALP